MAIFAYLRATPDPILSAAEIHWCSVTRTKMLHVKHFGTIGAENLTKPHTASGLWARANAQKTGIFGGSGRIRRLRLSQSRQAEPDDRTWKADVFWTWNLGAATAFVQKRANIPAYQTSRFASIAKEAGAKFDCRARESEMTRNRCVQ
ncbi:MAG: hypothetical protein ACREC0_03870 [Methylocella sp.]